MRQLRRDQRLQLTRSTQAAKTDGASVGTEAPFVFPEPGYCAGGKVVSSRGTPGDVFRNVLGESHLHFH